MFMENCYQFTKINNGREECSNQGDRNDADVQVQKNSRSSSVPLHKLTFIENTNIFSLENIKNTSYSKLQVWTICPTSPTALGEDAEGLFYLNSYTFQMN